VPVHAQHEWRPAVGHAPWDRDWSPGRARVAAWTRYRKPAKLSDGSIDPVTYFLPADFLMVAVNQALGPGPGVGFAASATDGCNGARPVTVRVFANEDDQTPTGGDGVFSPDAANIAPGTLRLRYERVGSGTGRVYLIVTRATDSSGNVGAACCTVAVPISSSASSIAAVKQAAAAVRTSCLAGNGVAPAAYFVVGDGPVIGSKQ